MKVVIAGGSGSVGRRLSDRLDERGHEVVVLTRQPRPGPFRQVQWDGEQPGPWVSELAGAAVVNLAGQLVDLRPTAANTERLRSSRVRPTTALVRAAAGLADPVPVWLQMSTTAIYGDRGAEVLADDAAPGAGPPQMPGVAVPWEEASRDARATRRLVLRTSLVLDRDAPVTDRLFSLTRWGLGGRLGGGQQWVSWIHVEDWLRVAVGALESDPHVPANGVLNVTAPEPVTNADLMRELRRALHRPWSPPTPTPLVRLGAAIMRTDPALALAGRRAVPKRLLDNGFRFEFADLPAALHDLVRRG